MSAAFPVRWMTPPEVAKRLGICPSRVIGWLRSGELLAVNLSDGRRPRYRISPEELTRFLASRSTAPLPRPARRKPRPSEPSYY